MSWDIYGNPLRRGYCEVHPDVHQEYPCSICMAQKQQQSQPHNELEQLQYEFAQQGDYIRHLESERAALANRIAELEREKAGLVAERDAFAIRLEDSEEQYSELHNKNSALAAQVEALRKALNDQLNDCINFDGGKLTDAIMKHSSDLLAATPQQHLAEIRAQAVLDFVSRLPSIAYMKKELLIEANQYAASIRQEGK